MNQASIDFLAFLVRVLMVRNIDHFASEQAFCIASIVYSPVKFGCPTS